MKTERRISAGGVVLRRAGAKTEVALISTKGGKVWGLPKGLVARINADTVSVLKEPATREKFVRQGAEPGFGPPEHFDRMQRAEYAELGALIKESGMKVQ